MAEALGHQEYEKRGKTRIPLFEEVIVYDEEGNPRKEERPKYTIPDLEFETLDLRDEATQRQYLMNLRQMGVPIPDDKLMVGIDWKPDDMIDATNEDLKAKTIAQQQAKMDTYNALSEAGSTDPVRSEAGGRVGACSLPVHPVPGGAPGLVGPNGQPSEPAGGMPGPGQPMGGGAAMTPIGGPGGIVMPGAPPGLGPGGDAAVPGGGAPPAGPMSPMRGTVPEVSNERRPGLTYNTSESAKVSASDEPEEQPEEVEDETPPSEWKLARNQELRTRR
jgi:hypothetical protein